RIVKEQGETRRALSLHRVMTVTRRCDWFLAAAEASSDKETRQAASLTKAPTSKILAFDLDRFHGHFLVGLILPVAGRLGDFFDYLVALHHFAEDRVLAGEPSRIAHRDKELRTVRVRPGIGHGELSGFVE